MTNKLLCLAVFSFLLIPAARCDEPTGAGLQIHGFLSQSGIWTSDNNFFGDSDDGISTGFTELGLNASYRFGANTLLPGQVLSRRAGEEDDGSLRLDFAQLSHVVSIGAGEAGIYLGKTKLPYGLYNETRDVAHTRPGIILPQSIYFDRTRDLALSATGVQVYGRAPLGKGALEVRAGYGYQDFGESLERVVFFGDRPGEFRSRGYGLCARSL
jgi:hypothetical protein